MQLPPLRHSISFGKKHETKGAILLLGLASLFSPPYLSAQPPQKTTHISPLNLQIPDTFLSTPISANTNPSIMLKNSPTNSLPPSLNLANPALSFRPLLNENTETVCTTQEQLRFDSKTGLSLLLAKCKLRAHQFLAEFDKQEDLPVLFINQKF